MMESLLERTNRFSYVQAMRLLRHHIGGRPGVNWERALENRVRVHPEISLAFPVADVADLEVSGEPGDERYILTARFLGLYGESSPLPAYYTEDLIEEAREDESACRDFIDILNGPLYHLLFRAATKYKLHQKLAEEREALSMEMLFSLIGFGVKEIRDNLPNAELLLRYAGLFTQFPRSALGLRTLLADAVGESRLVVESCVERKARIPADQQISLGERGSRLGEDAYLGETIVDRQGKFRLRVGPLEQKAYHAFMPDGGRFTTTCVLTRLYVTDPLECDLDILLDPDEVETARLGSTNWSRLGWNTWIFSGDGLPGETVPTATFRV